MESRARYIVVGLFIFITFLSGFGFVYWLNTIGGLGERAVYRVRFENSVSGLRVGAAVLFNGVRVGEVSRLQLSADDPRWVVVTIDVDPSTPVRGDTEPRIQVQGFMGSPALLLQGGSPASPLLVKSTGEPPMLIAGPTAGFDLTQAAIQVLTRFDKVLVENSTAFHETIANIETFSAALSRNAGRVDGILAGLEKMTGGAVKPPSLTFDLTAPQVELPTKRKVIRQILIAEPTTLIQNDTQKIVVTGSGGETKTLEDAQWSDALPKLVQAKIVESFENSNGFSSVGRQTEGLAADFQLLIDLREFRVSLGPPSKAGVEFVAKIVSKDGRITGSKVFSAETPLSTVSAESAAKALNAAFMRCVEELVLWTSQKI
jgi:phospholipid/cholesterol/gamma-HCH transport system substrate-binding protein